jgi:TolB-like protein
MKKNAVLVALFVFSAGAVSSQQSLTDRLSRTFSEQSASVIVMEFTNIDGSLSHLGRYLAEETTSALVRIPNVRVLERAQIDQILPKIMGFEESGLVREDQVLELGGMLGVDRVVTGTLTRSGRSIQVNRRIIDIRTGQTVDIIKSELSGSRYLRMYNDSLD